MIMLLKRVAGHSALPVSTAAGPKPPRHHLHGRKAAKTALHFHRLVRGFCGVSENPIKRGVVVGKVTQVVNGAVPDDRQAVSRLGDGSGVALVLLAEGDVAHSCGGVALV